MGCPCGSKLEYSQCCEPFISGKRHAPTPEALMRSRYSAYVKVAPHYLRETLAPETRHEFQEKEVLEWSKSADWLGLQILKAGGNQVEFVARYKYKTEGKIFEHHEVSTFRKDGEVWYFVDGESHVHEEGKGHESSHDAAPPKPMVRAEPKTGRNDPCTCGSGRKYKKCCGTAG